MAAANAVGVILHVLHAPGMMSFYKTTNPNVAQKLREAFPLAKAEMLRPKGLLGNMVRKQEPWTGPCTDYELEFARGQPIWTGGHRVLQWAAAFAQTP